MFIFKLFNVLIYRNTIELLSALKLTHVFATSKSIEMPTPQSVIKKAQQAIVHHESMLACQKSNLEVILKNIKRTENLIKSNKELIEKIQEVERGNGKSG
jgi:hypothetical protein